MTSLLAEAYQRRLVAFDEFYNQNHSKTDGKFVSGPSGSSKGKIWSGVSAHPKHRKVPKPKITIPVKGDEYQTAGQAALGLGQRLYAGNLGGGFRSHVTSVETQGHSLIVHVRITDESGKQVGMSDRQISTEKGKLVVDHSELYIEPRYHGQGIADRYNAHAVEQYQQLGVDHITLHAAATVGGFAWARQGFRYDEFGSADGNQARKEFMLRQLDRSEVTFNTRTLDPHRKRLNADVAALRKAVEAGEDVQPIHIASIGERYARHTAKDNGREYTTWPGKDLLLKTSWYGVYYFDASQAITAAVSSLEHARLRPAFYDDANIEVDAFFNQNHSKIDGKFTAGKSGFGGPSANPDNRTAPSRLSGYYTDIREMNDTQRLKFARSLFETNLPGEHHAVIDEDESHSVEDGKYYVRGHILTKYGRDVGFFERTIEMRDNTLVIGHDKLSVDDHSLHQLGIGTKFIGHSVGQYLKHGVDHVEVYAGDEVGGYMWAREGFRLKQESRKELIASFAVNAQAKVGRALRGGLVTQEQHNAIVAESNALIRASDHGEDVQPIHAAAIGRYAQWQAKDKWGNTYTTWAGKEGMLGQGYPADYFFDYANVTASAEEFYNEHHSKTDGRFTGGTSSPAPLQARRGVVPGYGPASLPDVHLAGVRVTYKPKYPDDHPDPGEVVWAKVPFEEGGGSKDRPVIVIGRVNGSDKLAAVQLTSKIKGRQDEYVIGTGTWDRLGRNSAVKLGRIIQIDPTNYRREGSVLNREQFDNVIGRLAAHHRTPVQIAASAQLEEFYNKNHSKKDGRFISGPSFKVITAAQARGDSRPVSHEEFQRLAHEGQVRLDGMALNSHSIGAMNRNWDTIKAETFAEVQKPWGGATIDSHTGRALPQGENAYALTVKDQKTDTVSVHEHATAQEFSDAMDTARTRFKSILEREGHHLGIFHDDENNRIDIDPVIVTRDHHDVETIGAATHAIGGAYNFHDGLGYWPPHVG